VQPLIFAEYASHVRTIPQRRTGLRYRAASARSRNPGYGLYLFIQRGPDAALFVIDALNKPSSQNGAFDFQCRQGG
jgi:hypothetical protein